MAANFASAEDFAESFRGMSREQQIQYLNEAGDKLRALRRQVLDTSSAESFIDRSTRPFTQGWQGELKADIAGGGVVAQGQTVTIDSRARDLYNALDAIG